ncbi:MAG: hypothetical protein J6Z32_00790 [Bacteroidales bacterium]|nr:hypothetical protein [Bacteroidales bacterium]MBR5908090.1 hypothetical protein [Bacteroidales bacterium]
MLDTVDARTNHICALKKRSTIKTQHYEKKTGLSATPNQGSDNSHRKSSGWL